MPLFILPVLGLLALPLGCAPAELAPSVAPATAPARAEEPARTALTSTSEAGSRQPGTAAPSATMPARVVAIGDLHADLPDALAVLQLARLVDEGGHWVGGEAVLVQTGDTTDRGPDSKEVLELLMALEGEARAAGGQVHALLGNHEAMNMSGDWRYVSAEDIADFGTVEARKAAFGPEGAIGQWLRERPAVAQVGDTVFVHGGISEGMAGLGVDGLNKAVAKALLMDPSNAILGELGPLWYRGYLQAPETIACAEAKSALATLGVRRMVMGHTTQRSGRVAVRCGGSLLGIDLGISTHYGDHHGLAEFIEGDVRAVYPTETEDLADP